MLGDTWRRGAALTILLAASAATAQDRVETQNAPPVAVGGFRYQHISPHTHMNVCEAAKCVPGSRVSYILAPGNFNPSFERYKDERERVAEALRGRAPAGSTISFDPPEQTTGRIFTLFKSRRADMGRSRRAAKRKRRRHRINPAAGRDPIACLSPRSRPQTQCNVSECRGPPPSEGEGLLRQHPSGTHARTLLVRWERSANVG